MTQKKISRRGFLTRTSLAASAASVSAVPGQSAAAQPQDYVQSEYSLRAKALVSVLTRKKLIEIAWDTSDIVYGNFGNHLGFILNAPWIRDFIAPWVVR